MPFLSFLAGNINNKKNKKQYNYRKDLIILRCCPSLSNGRFAAFFFTLFLVTTCCDLWVRSHVFVWLWDDFPKTEKRKTLKKNWNTFCHSTLLLIQTDVISVGENFIAVEKYWIGIYMHIIVTATDPCHFWIEKSWFNKKSRSRCFVVFVEV